MEDLDIQQLGNDYVLPWAINIGVAILIFVVGRMVVGMLVSLCTKLLQRAEMDEMLIKFLCSIMRWILLLMVDSASGLEKVESSLTLTSVVTTLPPVRSSPVSTRIPVLAVSGL